LPQAPQLVLSLAVLTQSPLHSVSPETQLVEQVPAEQAWPVGQRFPQVPQLALSVDVFVQTPLHNV
jgi:hypothetical protein